MRRRARWLVIGVVALALWGTAVSQAHHSFSAEFDERKPVKFTGTITQLKWSNPHAWVYVDVVGANKKVVNWALEIQAANAIYRRGWRKEDFAPGTVVQVEGYQARNGTPTANATVIALPSGRKLLGGPGAAAGAPAPRGGGPGR